METGFNPMEPEMKASESFSMNDADDREVLVAALLGRGIPAHEVFSGQIQAVTVTLISEAQREEFSIDAISDLSPCQVGLSGWRFGVVEDDEDFIDCLSCDSCIAASLTETISAFVYLWDQRESLMAKFRAGEYDLPPDDDE